MFQNLPLRRAPGVSSMRSSDDAYACPHALAILRRSFTDIHLCAVENETHGLTLRGCSSKALPLFAMAGLAA